LAQAILPQSAIRSSIRCVPRSCIPIQKVQAMVASLFKIVLALSGTLVSSTTYIKREYFEGGVCTGTVKGSSWEDETECSKENNKEVWNGSQSFQLGTVYRKYMCTSTQKETKYFTDSECTTPVTSVTIDENEALACQSNGQDFSASKLTCGVTRPGETREIMVKKHATNCGAPSNATEETHQLRIGCVGQSWPECQMISQNLTCEWKAKSEDAQLDDTTLTVKRYNNSACSGDPKTTSTYTNGGPCSDDMTIKWTVVKASADFASSRHGNVFCLNLFVLIVVQTMLK
jgi:hypothetical protein